MKYKLVKIVAAALFLTHTLGGPVCAQSYMGNGELSVNDMAMIVKDGKLALKYSMSGASGVLTGSSASVSVNGITAIPAAAVSDAGGAYGPETLLATQLGIRTYIDDAFNALIPPVFAEASKMIPNSETIGMIMGFPGSAPNSDWVACNGQYLDPVDYPALYSLIGYSLGASVEGNFRIPNLQGRVIIASGNAIAGVSTAKNQGATGGLATITLSTNNFPSHTHGISNAGAHSHSLTVNGFLRNRDTDTTNTGAQFNGTGNSGRINTSDTVITATVQDYGGSAPYSNLQPYLAVNYYIKAK